MFEKQKDHTELICNISELTGLFTHSSSLETFLQQIVEMTAHHMNAEVCSIYLYYEDNQELCLKATKGLNAKLVDNVRLKLGEGLTGLALKQLRPICERNASKNKSFRFFPGLGEEKFESFLSVPIVRGTTKIGAMVVQNKKKDYFTDEDIKILRAISSQLANIIEMTQLIMSMEEDSQQRKEIDVHCDLSFIKGTVGSAGFASAEAMIYQDDKLFQTVLNDKKLKKFSIEDFHKAVDVTEQELEQLQEQIEEQLSDVASLIFTAQILMLKDKGFIDAITEEINEGLNPPLAIIKIVEEYVAKFEQLPNAYLREKANDVKDVGRRLLDSLLGRSQYHTEYEGRIVIARELLPSDALKLSTQKVKGIIVLKGGATSHLSILARSLKIPLIIADVYELMYLTDKTHVILDAYQGNVYVDPSRQVKSSFKDHENILEILQKQKEDMTETTKSADGVSVHLYANINLLGDLSSANDFKAEGIGLYRTEFPFIVRNDFPNEEEQYVIYKKLVEGMPGKPITFRTLDIGGDKVLSYYEDHIKESNPYLGMRSIRFSLKHVDVFEQQIRAILRAGADADLRVMFPMISSVDQFRESKKIVMRCIKNLRSEKALFHSSPKIGMMIELPAVLEIIDDLAQESDFFSIGTNDFIQYMLAVDRTNEKVADQYLPHHPSILRALNRIAKAGDEHNISVSICGDMASDERYLEFILGIGIRELSINPSYLPNIQRAIKSINVEKTEKLTNNLLKKGRIDQINKLF